VIFVPLPWLVNVKRRTLNPLKPSLFIAIMFWAITQLIYIFGDPRISGGLYWHHISELMSFYFFGIWTKEIKIPFKAILVVSIVSPVLFAILHKSFSLFIVASILIIPFPLGYLVSSKIIKR